MKNLFLTNLEKTRKLTPEPWGESENVSIGVWSQLALAGGELILTEDHLVNIGGMGQISHKYDLLSPLYSVVYCTKMSEKSKGEEL